MGGTGVEVGAKAASPLCTFSVYVFVPFAPPVDRSRQRRVKVAGVFEAGQPVSVATRVLPAVRKTLGGSAPELTDRAWGPMPPEGRTIVSYGAPTEPAGSVGVR